MNNSIKINKFLSIAGHGSRRSCEKLILDGQIEINGVKACVHDRVLINDIVKINGKNINIEEKTTEVIILNKKTGTISSKVSSNGFSTVFEDLPDCSSNRGWISIGRLDLNTSGLMLFTNDGQLANFCMHPSNKFDKEYLVRARGNFNDNIKNSMLKGVIIDNKKYKFTDIVEGEKKGTNQWFSVCLISGKNREVRKIFNAFGLEISRLKRTRFGPIFLPSSLKPGKSLMLSDKEIKSIKDYHQS